MRGMDVSFGHSGTSLTVWFDNPKKEDHSERKDNADLILMKDIAGCVIGVEHLNYFTGLDGHVNNSHEF